VITLDEIVQGGSMSEGEPLEFIVRLKSVQMILEPIPVSLSFSYADLPERKELYSGLEKSYRILWKPVLPEISESQRAEGIVSIPLTVIAAYKYKDKFYRASRSVDLHVRLDNSRLRRQSTPVLTC
jgi:hypothetical protein